jgi:hypothetical protein
MNLHFSAKRLTVLSLMVGGVSSVVFAALGGDNSSPAMRSIPPGPVAAVSTPVANARPGASTLSTQTPASAEPSYMSYRYEGDRYRDPFIPLNGVGSDSGNDHAPQISSLILKGIIQDDKGRVAIMSSGVSSYILRAGRLYDGRNRPVKGISGVIKAQSVVLVGSDRVVKEFTLDKAAL